MKSIRVKILAWCFAIVFAALLSIGCLVIVLPFTNFGPMRMVRDSISLQADEAARHFELGGSEELRQYFERTSRHFPARHYLVTSDGKDALTGSDLSPILEKSRNTGFRPFRFEDDLVIVTTSAGGRHYLVLRRPPPTDLIAQLPYVFLILATMALFCWILAIDIARPLRRMADRVNQFGAGDLDARVRIDRRDEIGMLGGAFDEMASRIQTLLQAERQLLQDVSHELRSPLARLGVAAQLVKQEAHRDNAIQRIEREVERLGVLVGDLVAVTRAEGEWNTAGPHHTLRLDLLLDEIADTCRLEAKTKNLSIQLTNRAGSLELDGSAELLWRAIENIVRNAILHGPAGSVIELELNRKDGPWAELSVRDSGPGVPAADLNKIFRPFYRSDPSRNGDTGGVGLGLAIAHRAIAVHHGEIRAENAHPGLRVTILLPLPVKLDISRG